MRPHDQKASRKATGVGGVRAILKTKLWWREGFPSEGEWLVVPRSTKRDVEAISLTRSELSQATYAIKKLVGEFPKALPKVVGNAVRWEGNVRGLIESLKPWVHSNTDPVQSHFADSHYFSRVACKEALALVQKHPGLGKLVDALSWFLLSEPETALAYLRWVESEAGALTQLLSTSSVRDGLVLTVQLAHLGVVGQPLGTLLALLNSPTVPLRGAEGYQKALEKALRGGRAHLAEQPTSSLNAELRAQCDWLFAADRKTQTRYFRLLDLMQIRPTVQKWSRHWQLLVIAADKVDKLSKSFEKKEIKREKAEALAKSLSALSSRCPTSLHEATVLRSLRWFASEGAVLFKSVVDAINKCHGGGQSLWPWFLIHWYLLSQLRIASKGRLTTLLRAFADYSESPDSDLRPWTEPVIAQGGSGARQYSVDSEILEPDLRTADIALVFRAFSEFRKGGLVHAGKKPPKLALVTDEIIEFIRFTRDPVLSAQLALQLVANQEYEKYHSDSVVRAALLASERNRSNYVPMLRALARFEENTEGDVLVLFQTLQNAFANFPTMLEQLLLAKDIGALKECGQLLSSLSQLGASYSASLETLDSSSGWTRAYPSQFYDALECLCLVSPDAKRIAKRLSKGVLFQTQALERERDALIVVLGQSSGDASRNQKIRLANLEKRIADPAEVSQKKLDELVLKIEAAAGRERLRSIQRQALAALTTALCGYFGEDPVPEWMIHSDTLALVTGSFSLKGKARKLAMRLFRLRMQPSPWDLRDSPANRDFSQRMEKLGVEMSPWIDGIQMKRTTEEGVIHLRFADDPLDVFRMGAHFKTCLSPDGFNYFSVFANAADINKRVLYAYSDEGRVVGRQLLCLNEMGKVVAFHVYSHGGQWLFKKHSSAFISLLCEKMQTSTAVSGKIETLVSSDWYDDGAIGRDEHLAFLEADSTFVRGAGSWEPSTFAEELQRKLGKLALEHAMPALFRCGKFTERPELMAGIAARLRYDRLEGVWCVRVAKQLHQSGHSISTPLVKAIVLYLRKCHVDGWFDVSALNPLWKERPSLVLSVLRQTRDRGVRTWQSETSAGRLVLAAKSMLELKRPTKAATLFSLAIEVVHDENGAKKEARDYLASI